MRSPSLGRTTASAAATTASNRRTKPTPAAPADPPDNPVKTRPGVGEAGTRRSRVTERRPACDAGEADETETATCMRCGRRAGACGCRTGRGAAVTGVVRGAGTVGGAAAGGALTRAGTGVAAFTTGTACSVVGSVEADGRTETATSATEVAAATVAGTVAATADGTTSTGSAGWAGRAIPPSARADGAPTSAAARTGRPNAASDPQNRILLIDTPLRRSEVVRSRRSGLWSTEVRRGSGECKEPVSRETQARVSATTGITRSVFSWYSANTGLCAACSSNARSRSSPSSGVATAS
jgi:hypothetical protein